MAKLTLPESHRQRPAARHQMSLPATEEPRDEHAPCLFWGLVPNTDLEPRR